MIRIRFRSFCMFGMSTVVQLYANSSLSRALGSWYSLNYDMAT